MLKQGWIATTVKVFSLSHWERVGVRGYGPSVDLKPSPGSHFEMRSDLSRRER